MTKGMSSGALIEGLVSLVLAAACTTSSPMTLPDGGPLIGDAATPDARAADAEPEPDASTPMPDGGQERDSSVRDSGARADAPTCTCTGITECCDGCQPVHEANICFDTVPGTGGEGRCSSGECVGETCECSSGPCCDGCFYRPTTHRCGANVVYSSRCGTPSAACSGYSARIWEERGDVYCAGDAATCTGEAMHLSTVSRECGAPLFCSGPDGDAACDHTCS